MTYESNNTGVIESGQVVAPTIVAQEPIVHTSGPVFVSLGEKLDKFNGLNFKWW